MKEFALNLLGKMSNSMMQFLEPRQDFIMVLFKQSLTIRINNIITDIKLIENDLKNAEQNFINATNEDYESLKLALDELDDNYLNKINLYDEKNTILNDLSDDPNAELMFNLKNKSYESEDLYKITFENIRILFKIKPDDTISFFIIFLISSFVFLLIFLNVSRSGNTQKRP